MSQVVTTEYYGNVWCRYYPLHGTIISLYSGRDLTTINRHISNVSMTGKIRVFI